MTKLYHVGISPRTIIRVINEGRISAQEACQQPAAGTDDLMAQLRSDAQDGVLYQFGQCDAWDKLKGCPGHIKED